ncbi:hypothetical protein [Corynebacterium sp. HMSC074A09]|uniref:hypothetical protein n=1 Tax=Corynebacterium sp. HMSC074A09 TaxID=1739311 RepID=UPI000B07A9D5|nr:hypothetical protein [Corynebacterium sp. HMSC074A09]
MNTQRPAPWDAPKLVQLRLDDGATTQEELEAELAALARDLKSINARLEELTTQIKTAHGDRALASARRGLKTLKKKLTDRLRVLAYGRLPAPGLKPELAPTAYAGFHWASSYKTNLPVDEWFPPLLKWS